LVDAGDAVFWGAAVEDLVEGDAGGLGWVDACVAEVVEFLVLVGEVLGEGAVAEFPVGPAAGLEDPEA